MGYQALLFCPDEKTARTVTQVLSELEFSVDLCTEPFAAVKKLMAQHFDAIVVDCDNEQNATLLFKSARNSASNQASLAVAVVEGQAGVAKAFRIGANLVLTKPINVEQAKGTLRVARGLLRKGDPAKSAASAAYPVPQNPMSAPASAMPTRTVSQKAAAPPPTAARSDLPTPPQKPASTPSAATVAAATTTGASVVSATNRKDEGDAIGTEEQAPAPTANRNVASTSPFVKTAKPLSRSEQPPVQAAFAAEIKAAKESVSLSSQGATTSAPGGGTGSAAAPARSPEKVAIEKAIAPNTASPAATILEKTSDSGTVESSSIASPSLSFGGANTAEEPTAGRNKKALVGVAAVVVIAVGLYVGRNQLHEKFSAPEETPTHSAAVPANTATPQAPLPPSTSNQTPEPTSPASLPVSQPAPQLTTQKRSEVSIANNTANSTDKPAAAKSAAKVAGSVSASAAKSSSDEQTASQPIVLKNGTAPPAPSAAPDAAAPSVLGIEPSNSSASLSNLLSNSSVTGKPVLQTVNVSQGVSQGLLLKKVQPVYPSAAVRMHVEGSVQLLATIAKSGSITTVKVLSGEPILAQSAMDAVKQWKYKPYYLNGDPVEIQTQVTVNFKLPR